MKPLIKFAVVNENNVFILRIKLSYIIDVQHFIVLCTSLDMQCHFTLSEMLFMKIFHAKFQKLKLSFALDIIAYMQFQLWFGIFSLQWTLNMLLIFKTSNCSIDRWYDMVYSHWMLNYFPDLHFAFAINIYLCVHLAGKSLKCLVNGS